MANYLITGAAGFIGAAVAKRLLEQGDRVVSIDNLSTGYRENIPDGVEFFASDCQDPEVLKEIPRLAYDAILHIAGQSSGEISFSDPVYDLRTNTESTLLLLDYARQVGCHRFLYASTMSVYGVKPDRAISEDESAHPESFYGVGKLASEEYLRIYERFGIRSTALRLFNVYGPGQNMTNFRQGMVSIFMAQMLDAQHVLVKGSKDRYRDFVYIDDVVDAFELCLQRPESAGMAFNIGTGRRTSIEELLALMTRLYGKEVPVEFKGNTPGDIHGIYADIRRAENLLGFRPMYDLETGLNKMIGWASSSHS